MIIDQFDQFSLIIDHLSHAWGGLPGRVPEPNYYIHLVAWTPFWRSRIWRPFGPPLRPAEAPEMELQKPEVTWNFGPLETWDLASVRIGIRSTALFRKELSNGYRCAQILDPRHRSMTYDPDL